MLINYPVVPDDPKPCRDASARYVIGEASQSTGLTVHQIRSYVRFRMVTICGRTESGRVEFDDNAIRRLRLIGAGTRAGLLFKDIRIFLEDLDAGNRSRMHDSGDRLLDLARVRREAIDAFAAELREASANPRDYRNIQPLDP